MSDAPSRFVIDTNCLVSAFLFPQSPPGLLLERVLASHHLLMTMEVAQELVDVMRRDKFDRYLSAKLREELVAATIRSSIFIQTTTRIAECRDIRDDKYLELAVDGRADAIVTGDADLLVLNPFRGVPEAAGMSGPNGSRIGGAILPSRIV